MNSFLKAALLISVCSFGEGLMRAVVLDEGTNSLVVNSNYPKPRPRNRELLIRVSYTSLNRMDLVQKKGLYPLPPGASSILGVEVAGIVDEVHENCTLGFVVGDRVMALLLGGGYAEYTTVDERTVMKVPPEIDLLTAAAIPEALLTAHQLLFVVGRASPGDSILLHAAASSIGQSAIQMARSRGLSVFVTTRSADKLKLCLSLGATAGVVVGEDARFAASVMAANNGSSVNLVLDPVGGAYLEDNLDVLSGDGRLVSYGLLAGGIIPAHMNTNAPTGFLRKLLFKRILLLPSTLRGRSADYKAALINAVVNDVRAGIPAIADGSMVIHISAVYPLERSQEAHELMEANKNMGKIVLEVTPPEGTRGGHAEL